MVLESWNKKLTWIKSPDHFSVRRKETKYFVFHFIDSNVALILTRT